MLADYFSDEDESIVYGVKNHTILGSALGRQFTSLGDKLKYSKPIEICGTLFYGLIKNHAFHDGNKRTAFLILVYHLQKHGLQFIERKNKERIETLSVNLAANTLKENYERFARFKDHDDPEVSFVIDYLERNTRKTDKRYYNVTYNEFDSLLNKYDVKLENPHKNYIDVMQFKFPNGIFKVKKKQKWCKVMTIGFPGWKKKVGLKAVKEVLKKTGLNAENGIDSKVFFKGFPSLSVMIEEYNEPLRRLKDK